MSGYLNNLPDFDQVYNIIEPRLAPLEQERKVALARYKRTGLTTGICIALLVFGIAVTILYQNPIPVLACFLLAVLGIVLSGFQYYGAKQKYFEKVKGGLIPDIIDAVRPDLKYEPWDSIDGKEFFDTKLFDKKVDRFSGEDYLEGVMNGLHFRLTEIKLEQDQHRDGEGYRTFFEGLLIAIDRPLLKEGYLRIDSKKYGTFFSEIFEMLLGRDLPEIETTDAQFNKQYRLLSDSNQLVQEVFTQELVDNIFEVNKRSIRKGVFDFVSEMAYDDGAQYIVIEHKHDLFLPKVQHNLLNKESTRRFYNDLMYALQLVDRFTKM